MRGKIGFVCKRDKQEERVTIQIREDLNIWEKDYDWDDVAEYCETTI